jgi:uncharacterized OsmC-like protein
MTEVTVTDDVRNGVDTATLFATLDAVSAQRELANGQFRVRNRWISGTHNRSTFDDFYVAGGEQRHVRTFTADADHPEVLVGEDNGPSGAEYVLHALAACLTHGIANIAAARKVTLTEVSSTIEGDVDLQGLLGMDDTVRNGYSRVRVSFTVKGDAPAEKLRAIVEQSRARSAVWDIMTNGVPITIDVSTA